MKRLITIVALAAVAVVLVRPRGGTTRGASPFSAVGRALRGLRSGDARAAVNDPVLRELPHFELSSPAFADGTPMHEPYVDAQALQPPLTWTGVPGDAVELAVIVEDIDVPFPAPLVHAVAYGIDPAAGKLPAGAIPRIGHNDEGDASIAIGRGAGGAHFLPPTPIPGHGPHRYVFQAFALREKLAFKRPPGKRELVRALRDRAVAQATVTGTHER